MKAHKDDEEGYGVVANSIRDVKKNYLHVLDYYDEFTDIRVNWIKDMDKDIVQQLSYGEVDAMTGLEIGLYSYIYGEPCQICGDDSNNIYFEFGQALCSECMEKVYRESR